MNKKALILTFLFFIISLFVVFLLTDFPLSFSKSFRTKKISAIAIRDNVSAFEKRGSALFTIPYLKKYYFDFTYVEAKHNWIGAADFRRPAEKLLEKCDSLDVYILSHGNYFYQWFYGMDSSLRKKIRLVYNTGCDNDSQYVMYKEQMVSYYVGHTGEKSLSPIFYVYFLRRMFSENSIESIVRESNVSTENKLRLFISDEDTINGSLGVFHDLRK